MGVENFNRQRRVFFFPRTRMIARPARVTCFDCSLWFKSTEVYKYSMSLLHPLRSVSDALPWSKGGKPRFSVSKVLTLDMDEAWIDDTTRHFSFLTKSVRCWIAGFVFEFQVLWSGFFGSPGFRRWGSLDIFYLLLLNMFAYPLIFRRPTPA